MATLFIKSSEITTGTSIDLANDKVMAVNGTSNKNIPMQSLLNAAQNAARNNIDGILVYCVYNSSIKFATLQQWESLKSNHTPIGVILLSGDKNIVIALEDALCVWSTANVLCDQAIHSVKQQFNDFNGEGHTAAIVTHSECSGANCAAGFCYNYSKTNSQNKGLEAGKWWLAATGEMSIISANIGKVNHALSKIDGATLIPLETHWLSTENSDAQASSFDLSNGSFSVASSKTTKSYRVRPISTIQ